MASSEQAASHVTLYITQPSPYHQPGRVSLWSKVSPTTRPLYPKVYPQSVRSVSKKLISFSFKLEMTIIFKVQLISCTSEWNFCDFQQHLPLNVIYVYNTTNILDLLEERIHFILLTIISLFDFETFLPFWSSASIASYWNHWFSMFDNFSFLQFTIQRNCNSLPWATLTF